MRLLTCLLVALALVGLGAPGAVAQPGLPLPTPDSCEPFPYCLGVPQPGVPSLPAPPPLPAAPDHGELTGLFSVNDGHGRDLQHYDLFANLPSVLSNPMPTIWLWLANIGFAVGKYALGFAVWFVEWSMSAAVVDWIKAPAQELEKIWQTEVIGGLKLRQVALLVATAYLGLLFFRGLSTRAWRETASTIAISVLATAVLTHPVDFLVGDDGVLDLSRDLGLDVTAVVMGQEPGCTGTPAAPIGQALIDNLLISSWETLNYGSPITSDPDVDPQCKESVSKVLDEGPWSDQDDSTPACELDHCPDTYGKYNEVADADRALGAWFYAVAMILFAILTICLNSIQILAAYFLLFEGLLLGLALSAALVPAWQHQLAYRVSSIATTIARLLMGMLCLAVMTLLLRSLLLVDLGPQAVRFAVIDLVIFSGFLFRKRLTVGMQKMRARVNTGLQRAGRRGQAPKPLPAPIVPPGPQRLSRAVKAGTGAFREAVAPAQQLAQRTLAASKAGGKVGSKVLSYTAGAPVSWPAAAGRARTALTTKGAAAKNALAAKATTAKGYAGTYASNLGKLSGASPAFSLVTSALANRSGPGAHRLPDGADPAAARISALTPRSSVQTPMFEGVHHSTQTQRPQPLPPGMLAPPNPLVAQLRDRLAQGRRS
ncbi:hypothetical protein [Amycolatopsis magusensis]|uniref:hypothetical protein n=1 Tax=Amycolatopsis magusensis TaxID=882444 RepID=UPI0024A8F32C|nr:hypothetical protein [Amycolatopsis magusensis]MDI5979023.1 hypothetical protein [Amycolatopsis magusensis]